MASNSVAGTKAASRQPLCLHIHVPKVWLILNWQCEGLVWQGLIVVFSLKYEKYMRYLTIDVIVVVKAVVMICRRMH